MTRTDAGTLSQDRTFVRLRVVMRNVLAPSLCILALLSAATRVSGQDTVEVVVAATSDVHGHVYHWDYLNDREAPWGLTRAATVVDSLRAAYPGRVIVVDVGDLTQGSPFATYFATESQVEPHPVVGALSAVGYDVATLGNHDFNYGLETLWRALRAAAFPIVSANVYRLPRDTFAFQPEVILQRGGVRVGVTGFTTPGVMVWDRENVAGGVVVRPILPAAESAMRRLDLAGADLRVAAIHSGLDLPSSYDTTGVGAENVAAQLAGLPVKPHVVLAGHSHARIVDSVIDGVHFLQPAPWARSMAVAHVWLVKDANGRFRVERVAGEELPLGEVRPHQAVSRRLEQAHRTVREWVGTPLATSEGDWSAQLARAQDTPVIDFVNEVQRRASGADLSATAAFSTGVGLGPGAVNLRHVAAVYPYENMLKAVRIDGGTLKDYLEQSAAYFRTFRSGEPVFNDSVPGYNYDIVSGVEYVLDLTQPVGSRVRQLIWRGRLVQPTDTFTLALNSYRQGGGGNFAMLRDLPVVYDRWEDVRDLIVAFVRRAGVLRAADYFVRSWSIVPSDAQSAVRAAFDPTGPAQGPSPADSAPSLFAVRDTLRPAPPPEPEPPIASVKLPVERGPGEHPLGRLIADARRNGARAHFAIVQNAAIGGDIPAGPVTRGQLLEVLPDDEPLARLTVPGEVLRAVLEHVLAESEPIAHVSGLEVWYDPGRPAGRRVRRVRLPDGRDVRGDGTYTLAVSTAVADGAAGFVMLSGATREDTGVTDVAALVAYLQRLPQPAEAPVADRFHRQR